MTPMKPANPPPPRWYPTTAQLSDPASTERTVRQILDMHYQLQDQHTALLAKVNAPAAKPSGPPPGSGPSDSMLLGLRVLPVDANQLADGAKLQYSAADGNFQFK